MSSSDGTDVFEREEAQGTVFGRGYPGWPVLWDEAARRVAEAVVTPTELGMDVSKI